MYVREPGWPVCLRVRNPPAHPDNYTDSNRLHATVIEEVRKNNIQTKPLNYDASKKSNHQENLKVRRGRVVSQWRTALEPMHASGGDFT